MRRGALGICRLGAAILALAPLTLSLGGCVKHVRDLKLLAVEPVVGHRSQSPELKLTFTSTHDLRGLHGHRVFLWTSLCPVNDDMRIDTADVYMSGVEVQPGQDVPARIEDDAPPLVYSSIIAYQTAFIDTRRDEAGPYRLLLPPDGLDLCFRVESTGFRHFRTKEVMIPKDAIAKALQGEPAR